MEPKSRTNNKGDKPDCQFLVGTHPRQQQFEGYRAKLAQYSPVFHAMFFGYLVEKPGIIAIPDVEPAAFKVLIDYSNGSELKVKCYADPCDLYYAATKYMFREVLPFCEQILLKYLTPRNACYTYEFAKFFGNQKFAKEIMSYIAANTHDIIKHPIFLNVEPGTLIDIFDQKCLGISSEVELFVCLQKFATRSNDDEFSLVRSKAVASDVNQSDVLSTGEFSRIWKFENVKRIKVDETTLREAVKKIAFLTMSRQEFEERPLKSKLLTQDESSAILAAIKNNDSSIPEGFCKLRELSRCGKRTYTLYITKKWGNAFKTNRNIYILSVKGQSPQDKDNDFLLYASVYNSRSEKIGHTNSMNRKKNDIFELVFHRPIFIPRNELFTLEVHFDSRDEVEQLEYNDITDCNGVKFTFQCDRSRRLQRLTYTPYEEHLPFLLARFNPNRRR